LHREQVDEQCAKAVIVERFSHEPIPRAVPAAAASVSKKHDSRRCFGQHQIALDGSNANVKLNGLMN
jgi:hypothetical protein